MRILKKLRDSNIGEGRAGYP